MQQNHPVEEWYRAREGAKRVLLRNLMHNPSAAVRYILRCPGRNTDEQVALLEAAIAALRDEIKRLKGG